jgi:hypothetical protein
VERKGEGTKVTVELLQIRDMAPCGSAKLTNDHHSEATTTTLATRPLCCVEVGRGSRDSEGQGIGLDWANVTRTRANSVQHTCQPIVTIQLNNAMFESDLVDCWTVTQGRPEIKGRDSIKGRVGEQGPLDFDHSASAVPLRLSQVRGTVVFSDESASQLKSNRKLNPKERHNNNNNNSNNNNNKNNNSRAKSGSNGSSIKAVRKPSESVRKCPKVVSERCQKQVHLNTGAAITGDSVVVVRVWHRRRQRESDSIALNRAVGSTGDFIRIRQVCMLFFSSLMNSLCTSIYFQVCCPFLRELERVRNLIQYFNTLYACI